MERLYKELIVEIRRIDDAGTMNVTVDYDGTEAVLVKSPGINAGYVTAGR